MKTQEQLMEEMNSYSSSDELIKRHEVEDSPFTIIQLERTAFGTMGKFRITEPVNFEVGEGSEAVAEIKNMLENITWNRIVQVMLCLMESKSEIEESLKEQLDNINVNTEEV